nr:nucleotidyltransferase domain-containing protein [Parvularcula mediterranea]
MSPKAEAVFGAAEALSDKGIADMRAKALEVLGEDKSVIVGVNGSYARREVTSGSDVDLFFLYTDENEQKATELQNQYREALTAAKYEMPALGGVFSKPLSALKMRERIGGLEDRNIDITRRMLMLLEGEWIFNKKAFEEARCELLKQYIPPTLREEQICLFLLNDIIRYWRTICVDFEFKTQKDGKAKEIRLIKLRFSRMLLFLAGVLAVGETYEKPVNEKIAVLTELFALPPVERIQSIAGDRSIAALEMYAGFLDALNDEATRTQLSQKLTDGDESRAFTELRQRAHDFRDALLELLKSHFSDGNPTIAALML